MYFKPLYQGCVPTVLMLSLDRKASAANFKLSSLVSHTALCLHSTCRLCRRESGTTCVCESVCVCLCRICLFVCFCLACVSRAHVLVRVFCACVRMCERDRDRERQLIRANVN